jgi:rare lipoprotein A
VKEVLEGIASWYGPRFEGRTTASGERFDENALTAAHATLALGTRVRVTNLRNGRKVVVRINDRGPAYPDRILDVSRAAAAVLGMIRPGKVPVRIEVLGERVTEGERPSS